MATIIKPHVKQAMQLHKRYYTNAYRKPIPDEELAHRQALIPQDTRDFTGKLMGDPIPGDKRRQQCKSTDTASFAEDTSW